MLHVCVRGVMDQYLYIRIMSLVFFICVFIWLNMFFVLSFIY